MAHQKGGSHNVIVSSVMSKGKKWYHTKGEQILPFQKVPNIVMPKGQNIFILKGIKYYHAKRDHIFLYQNETHIIMTKRIK